LAHGENATMRSLDQQPDEQFILRLADRSAEVRFAPDAAVFTISRTVPPAG
jgi:hypothetical protein